MTFVGAGLEQLWDNSYGADVKEGASCERQQHVTPLQTRAHKARALNVCRPRVTTKFLNSDTNACSKECTNRRNKLCAHGGPFAEARLNQQREVADLVGYFVEEDSHCGCGTDGGRGIEGGAEREPVRNVVSEVGDEIEVTTELHTGTDLLLTRGCYCSRRFLTVRSGLASAQRVLGAICLNTSRLGSSFDLFMGMSMRMVVPSFTTRSDPQALVHGYEGDEADHDGHAEQEVLVGLDHDEFDLVVLIFAEKDLWQQVEQCITQ